MHDFFCQMKIFKILRNFSNFFSKIKFSDFDSTVSDAFPRQRRMHTRHGLQQKPEITVI